MSVSIKHIWGKMGCSMSKVPSILTEKTEKTREECTDLESRVKHIRQIFLCVHMVVCFLFLLCGLQSRYQHFYQIPTVPLCLHRTATAVSLRFSAHCSPTIIPAMMLFIVHNDQTLGIDSEKGVWISIIGNT